MRARLGRVHEADAGFLAQMLPQAGAMRFIRQAPAGSESVDSVRVARERGEAREIVYDTRAALVVGVAWVQRRE